MGMSASQARLLQITARIHDVEYQAQAIENAKVQLATKSDQVYSDYLEALNATTMTIAAIGEDGSRSIVAATFNNLCGKNKVNAADNTIYALKDSRNRLIVPQEIAEGYQRYKTSAGTYKDAQDFAMFMITGQTHDVNDIDRAEDELRYISEEAQTKKDAIIDWLSKNGFEADTFYDTNNLMSDGSQEQKDEYNALLNSFKYSLYKSNGADIYASLTQDPSEKFDQSLFDYYVSMYNQIQASGERIVSIEDFNGTIGESDAANDSEWLQAMVECGKISIHKVKTGEEGVAKFSTTSPSSDTSIAYTETTAIDKTALVKAEAKYEHDLKTIDKQDKRYDMELSKLETERTALTTQYESLQKVIEDNIDRTFGIFS